CLRICRRQFPSETNFLLCQLWERALTNGSWPQNGLILVYFLEDFLLDLDTEFVLSPNFVLRVQKLLHSKQRKDRQSANAILKKLNEINSRPCDIYGELVDNALQCCREYLFSYDTIKEYLETPKTLATDDYWLVWIRKLSVNLLSGTSNEVLYGTFEYFLDHVTFTELCEANLLPQFLEATNNIDLYNLEHYCLPVEKMREFVAGIDANKFFQCFCFIPWHEVPFIHWLDCLKPHGLAMTDVELFLHICEKVRNLENAKLRNAGQNFMFNLFQTIIAGFSVIDYLKFIETLFNESEDIGSHAIDLLTLKIENSQEMVFDIKQLNKKRFDLICGNELKYGLNHLYAKLIEKLKELPKDQHGWWRLPVFFGLFKSKSHVEFYSNIYKVNFQLIDKCYNVKELQKHFIAQLNCETSDEKEYVMRSSVDLFVKFRLTTWSQLENLNVNPLDVLACGSIHTFAHLAHLLGESDHRLRDENILKTFLKLWKEKKTVLWAIEKVYCIQNWAVEYSKRPLFINHAQNLSKLHLFRLFDELLHINSGILKNEEYIIENSKGHRIQIRIAIAMLRLYPSSPGYWSDQLWQSLLMLKTHLTISYFYECLVAIHLPRFSLLSDKIQTLSTLQSKQQDAIISVVHIYCLRNWKNLTKEELTLVFKLLWKEKDHLNSQSTYFALLVLHNLAKKCEETSIDIPIAAEVKTQLELFAEKKVEKCCVDARLMLPEILLVRDNHPSNLICYMTNAPYDEYDTPLWLSSRKTMSKLNQIRDGFRMKPKEF
ncbi:hypothetical protein KR222_004713, partial [Zaprionus bogoriensis]